MSITVEQRLTPPLPPQFYRELMGFYLGTPMPPLSLTWEVVSKGFLGPLDAALRSDSAAAVADVLGHAYQRKIMYGLDSSSEHLDCYDLGLGSREYLTKEYFIEAGLRLLRLVAANCGAPAPNSEQPTVPLTPEEMVEAIEACIGCRLDFPGGGGVSGLVIDGRYIPHKLIDAAGVIAAMKRLPCWPPSGIVEVGAGAQWVEYFLSRLGVPYSIVDLPIVKVIGTYMARVSLGDACMETEMPTFVDLVLNQNSFPEIADVQQEAYVGKWEHQIRTNGYFLSINHESDTNQQRRAYAVLSKSPLFKLVHRSPWWQRPGWVEEAWRHI